MCFAHGFYLHHQSKLPTKAKKNKTKHIQSISEALS